MCEKCHMNAQIVLLLAQAANSLESVTNGDSATKVLLERIEAMAAVPKPDGQEERAYDFKQGSERDPNVYIHFYGERATGKTVLAAKVQKALLDLGFDIELVTDLSEDREILVAHDPVRTYQDQTVNAANACGQAGTVEPKPSMSEAVEAAIKADEVNPQMSDKAAASLLLLALLLSGKRPKL